MSLWRRIYIERRAVVLPLLVIALGNVAALALAVLPLKRSVASYEQAEIAARTRLANAQLLDRSAKDARAKKEQADQELNKFYSDILPAKSTDAIQIAIFWLQRTAAASGLGFKNSTIDLEPIKDSQLERVKGKVTLDGDYADIRRFLYAVETGDQFLIIEKVELTQPTQMQNGTGSLEVTLDLATYYRPPGSRGVGGQ